MQLKYFSHLYPCMAMNAVMPPHKIVLNVGGIPIPLIPSKAVLKPIPKVAACIPNQPILATAMGRLIRLWATMVPIAAPAVSWMESPVSLLCIAIKPI
ncbi:hypothetical protein Holit_02956 [Hollandina sp. SP2]